MRRSLAIYLGGTVVLGALGGLLWAKVTPIASYTVLDGLAAYISERSQATISTVFSCNSSASVRSTNRFVIFL